MELGFKIIGPTKIGYIFTDINGKQHSKYRLYGHPRDIKTGRFIKYKNK
jgi:hypothetical protein